MRKILILLALVVGGADCAEAASARYWRVLFQHGSDGGAEIVLRTVEFRTSIGGAQAATGGTASASSEFASRLASHAFDADSATFWATATNQHVGSWLKYDFGSGNDVEIVEISFLSNSATTYGPQTIILQSSTDDTNWQSHWYSVSSGWAISTTYTYSADAGIVLAGGKRYWRVNMTAKVASNEYSLVEVYWHTGASAPNLAPMAAATSATVFSATYPARLSNDTKTNNFWASSSTPASPEWLSYDFGYNNAPSFDRVLIEARGAGGEARAPTAGTIQNSTDGSSWTTVYTFSGLTWSANETKTFLLPVGARSRGYIFGSNDNFPAWIDDGKQCRWAA